MSYPSDTSHSLLGFQVLGRSSGQEMYQVHTFVLCTSFTIDKDFLYLGPSACLLKMFLTKNVRSFMPNQLFFHFISLCCTQMPPLCVGPFDLLTSP